MSHLARSFPYVAGDSPKILILGSMPGKASLTAQQYYAHPHNLFWPFMAEITGISANSPYQQRLQGLIENGIALWDVLHECERASSLDSDIIEASIVANDFAGFFARYPTICTIYFNGNKAEQAFKRYALPQLADVGNLVYCRLPSTSPANASVTRNKKLTEWKRIQISIKVA